MQFPALEIDHTVTDWVVDHRIGWLTDVFHVITTVGNTFAMSLVALVATVWLAVRGHRRQAVLVLAGSVAGYLVMVGLKHLFGRDRPPRADRLVDIDTYAFPSGHAMMSGIVLGLVAVAAWQVVDWVRAHPAVLVLAPVASFVIGSSRVYLGVHWMSDVVGGWLFALVWVSAAVWVARAVSVQSALRGPIAPTAGAALGEEHRGAEHPDR